MRPSCPASNEEEQVVSGEVTKLLHLSVFFIKISAVLAERYSLFISKFLWIASSDCATTFFGGDSTRTDYTSYRLLPVVQLDVLCVDCEILLTRESPTPFVRRGQRALPSWKSMTVRGWK